MCQEDQEELIPKSLAPLVVPGTLDIHELDFWGHKEAWLPLKPTGKLSKELAQPMRVPRGMLGKASDPSA